MKDQDTINHDINFLGHSIPRINVEVEHTFWPCGPLLHTVTSLLNSVKYLVCAATVYVIVQAILEVRSVM